MKKIKKNICFLLIICSLSILFNVVNTDTGYGEVYNQTKNQNKTEKIDVFSITDIDTLDCQRLNVVKEKILSFDTDEFVRFINNYIRLHMDNKQKIKDDLEKIGVYIEFANNEQNISIQKIEAYEMEHEIAIARRAGSQLYYVSYMFKFNKKETCPGSYDVLGLFWDSDRLSYDNYSTSETKYVDLRDITNKKKGTLVFNVFDKNIEVGKYYYATVVLAPKVVDGNWYEVGAKYTHTFTTTQTSISLSNKIDYGGSGVVSGSIGYTVTINQIEQMWEKAADNAFKY